MKIVRESLNEMNFQRKIGDPLGALGIGQWKDGYIIEREPKFTDLKQSINALIKFKDYNWTRKAYDITALYKQTQLTSDIEKDIEKLPVVRFKHYYNEGNLTGLFGNWPTDFPYMDIPFIAEVEEDKGRTFLIGPEGFDYPRYITELV